MLTFTTDNHDWAARRHGRFLDEIGRWPATRAGAGSAPTSYGSPDNTHGFVCRTLADDAPGTQSTRRFDGVPLPQQGD
jgi:hypothetical protein